MDQGIIAGSEITFRSRPRGTWPIVINSIYHGPSKPMRPDRLASLLTDRP
ncbi:MAG TPA: hypothetical protein VGP70_16875 [Actinomadura sp.]|jgi:hypothetical protein|nr:hypothetical protein [Actinomadura sp.]